MPDFNSAPGTPPPSLDLEVTRVDGHTQTGATFTRDKATATYIPLADAATQVLCRPHRVTSLSQTSTLATRMQDQSTQVLLRPRRSEAFSQTAWPSRTTAWSQTYRPAPTSDTGTDMPPVPVASTCCKAGAYFDNDVNPPGAPVLAYLGPTGTASLRHCSRPTPTSTPRTS